MLIFDSASSRWSGRVLSVLRIVAALLLIEHGTQKILGFPPSGGPPMPYVVASLNGVAGILESGGGLLLLLGLLTRPVAFLLAGEMAVAYFHVHAPQAIWPIANRGELAVIFCFVFLYVSFAGGGPWSVDAVLRRSRLVAARMPASRDEAARRAA